MARPRGGEQAYPQPADVELPGLHGELGGVGIGVVVVVQFLAADQDAPGHHVLGGVRRLEVAVAGVVAHAVDHAGGEDGNPQHLRGPDDEAHAAEQRQIDGAHEADAEVRVRYEDVALPPVVRRPAPVLRQRLRRAAGAVVLGAAPEDLAQAVDLRAVGIVLRLGGGVVAAMHGRPLLGDHASGQPQPSAEEEGEARVQIQRPVRRVAMQVDRHRHDGHMGHGQRVDHRCKYRQPH